MVLFAGVQWKFVAREFDKSKGRESVAMTLPLISVALSTAYNWSKPAPGQVSENRQFAKRKRKRAKQNINVRDMNNNDSNNNIL